MRAPKIIAALIGSALLTALGGCLPGDPGAGLDVCKYLPGPAGADGSSLTPECRALLESILPFNNDSFATAPKGMKDRITEAFQAMIAYPLVAPPESKILGTSPEMAGAIPLVHWRIFQESADPNESIFNFVVNQIDEIRYMPPDDSNKFFGAAYTYQATTHIRVMHIYDGYDNSFSEGIPLYHVSTLIHEARHGDGQHHEPCPANSSYAGITECDPSLEFSHGIEVTYNMFLLHGSAVPDAHGKVWLTKNDVANIGYYICDEITNFIMDPYQEIKDLMASTHGCYDIDYKWVMTHEGLPLQP